MDGGRQAHLDAIMDKQTTDASPAHPHRCGWCELLPLPEDEEIDQERDTLWRVSRYLDGCRLAKPAERQRVCRVEMMVHDDALRQRDAASDDQPR